MKLLAFLIIFLIVFSDNSIAQVSVKNEIEKQIDAELFPQNALAVIQSQLSNAKRIKYYIEVNNADTSYEVKFKKNKSLYSVEFSREGLFEDVEMLIAHKEFSNEIKSNIHKYLNDNFIKHKIKKIQVQYKHPSITLEQLNSLFNEDTQNFNISYEIEIAVKHEDGSPAMYEFHFDSLGQYIDKRIFKQQGDDNILY
ncbi:MAG: hypothetical protein C0599_10750 [Salinivirgaceae bacterium]|nr:MAG: hypothetical protein C0599_10750 [Salinivirgaceae bacterium]